MKLSADQYSDPENWLGSLVELAMLLGPGDDQRLLAAVR
jgi:hypothetical protein